MFINWKEYFEGQYIRHNTGKTAVQCTNVSQGKISKHNLFLFKYDNKEMHLDD